MRRVVYTCIIGNYDTLKDPYIKDPNFDYIAFTNNPSLKSNHWQIRQINVKGLDNTRAARRVKILCTEYLKDYDLSVWIDGSIQIKSTLIDLVQKVIIGKDIVALTHGRNCIYQEAIVCKERLKDDPTMIDFQMKYYQSQGFPKNQGLISTGLLIRRHTDKIDKFMKAWWEQVKNYSKRDQLSFNFVQWKHRLNLSQLPFDILRNSTYFNLALHSDREVRIRKRRGRVVHKRGILILR